MPHKDPLKARERRLAWYQENKEREQAAGRAYYYARLEHNRARVLKYLVSPKGRYSCQKSKAKERGIEWKFTFEEWWALWEPRWAERGCGKDRLVMARYGDSGPYETTNVRICSLSENSREGSAKANEARWAKDRLEKKRHAVGSS